MGQEGKGQNWRGPWGGDGCGDGHTTKIKYLKDTGCGGDAEPPKEPITRMATKCCASMPVTGPVSALTILRL